MPVKVEGWNGQGLSPSPTPKLPRKAGANACSRPSIPWSGSAAAPSACSISATASRSIRRSRKRIFGYYVLPFLEGDRLTSRVCLKADRQDGTSARECRAWRRRASTRCETAEAAAPELRRMATWLGLDDVDAAPNAAISPSPCARRWQARMTRRYRNEAPGAETSLAERRSTARKLATSTTPATSRS